MEKYMIKKQAEDGSYGWIEIQPGYKYFNGFEPTAVDCKHINKTSREIAELELSGFNRDHCESLKNYRNKIVKGII